MQIKPNNMKNYHKKTHKSIPLKIFILFRLVIKWESKLNLKTKKNLLPNQHKKSGISLFPLLKDCKKNPSNL